MPSLFSLTPTLDLSRMTPAQQQQLATMVADNLISNAPGNNLALGEDNLLAMRDATRYAMAVTATNILSQLPVLPLQPQSMTIEVNTQDFDYSSGAFTLVGRTVTWNPGVAGFDLDPGDAVFAIYK